MANRQVIAALQTQIDGILSQGNGTVAHKKSRSPKNRGESPEDQQRTSDSVQVSDGRLCDSNVALKKIIALVNASDKSEQAIRNRLLNEGFNAYAVEEAISQAKDYGFIDDARYADVLIRSRISQLRGSAGIVRELSENGIDANAVEGWPYDFPVTHEEEINRALSLLDRKPPRSKNMREAAYRRLMQRGYSSSVSSSAARIWAERSQ